MNKSTRHLLTIAAASLLSVTGWAGGLTGGPIPGGMKNRVPSSPTIGTAAARSGQTMQYRSDRIGSRPAGNVPFGLAYLSGNVGEWVWDWFGSDLRPRIRAPSRVFCLSGQWRREFGARALIQTLE